MGHEVSVDLPTSNCAIRSLNCAITSYWRRGTEQPDLVRQSRCTPTLRGAHEAPLVSAGPSQEDRVDKEPATFLYLAYGSNLCAETFRGKRGIVPLSQTNVVVPSIALTFDLPGVPYVEPCFGNCRYRSEDEQRDDLAQSLDYHKDRWHKGLVGVVYEVTAADYAHIIATEGGGAGYHDVLVDAWPLATDPDEEVPLMPTGTPLKAHTLFAPPQHPRSDPSYAQPSARYKKLITDGADEHNLPHEYRVFLDGLRTYRVTTLRQKTGAALFITLWGPIISFLMTGGARFLLRPDGTYPPWFARIVAAVFTLVWLSYDAMFKPFFGDGERTLKPHAGDTERGRCMWSEKTPLLSRSSSSR